MSSFLARSAISGVQLKRRSLSRLMVTSALVAAGAVAMAAPAQAADYTLPVNGSVVGGSATIAPSGIDKLNVNQHTDRTVINWDSFNIGTDATVQFYQPGANSLAVNRVVGAGSDPTRILGTLRANGQVMVLDRNGVLFGNNSIVDVGGIIASTGDVSTASVMANDSILTLGNFGAGEIVNNGGITAADGGLVAFVGPTVKNNGIITAKLGRVSLAAGNESATVDLYGDGLVELAYTDKNDNLLSENSGQISAAGGKIHMTAAAAKDIVDSVVNMNGVAYANSASISGGKIILSAKKVKVTNAASVKADTVTVTAKSVDLDATIDGVVDGSAQEVNIKSNNAKIMQGLDIIDENGQINVAAGTFDEDIVIDVAGVILNGAFAGVDAGDGSRGVGETLITPHSPGVVITADNVTVDGLSIDGASNGIEVLSGADHANIKNNIITNSSNHGVYIVGSLGSTLKDNLIQKTGNHGIYVVSSNGINLNANQVGVLTSKDFNINGDAIRVEVSDDAVIYNNRVANTTSTAGEVGSGIILAWSNNANIVENTIFDTDWDGIKLTGGNHVSVSGNEIDHAKRAGIFSIWGSDVSIASNTVSNVGIVGAMVLEMLGSSSITGNTISDIGEDGIRAFSSGDVTVSENIVRRTGGHGIALSKVSAGTNTVDKNIINKAGLNGVNVVSSAVSVSGNEIGLLDGMYNIHGDGILMDDSDNSEITGNKITNTSNTATDIGSGIHVKDSDNVQVTNNTIFHTDWDGVKITGGDNVTVSGNDIDQVVRTGIFAKWGSNLSISTNDIFNAGIGGIVIADMEGPSSITNNHIDQVWHEDAISVYNSDETTVSGNLIGYGDDGLLGSDDTFSGRDGIRVSGSSNVDVLNNKIVNSYEDGIHAMDVGGLIQIKGNAIDNSTQNGVLVEGYAPGTVIETFALLTEGDSEGSDFVGNKLVVSSNNINESGNNGVSLYGVEGIVEVADNYITDSGNNGVYVGSSRKMVKYESLFDYPSYSFIDLLIQNNWIAYSNYNGVYLDGISGDIRVLDNEIQNSFYGNGVLAQYVNNGNYMPSVSLLAEGDVSEGYPTNAGDQLIIDGNTIDQSGNNGVSLYNVGGLVRVSANDITNSAYDGIYAYNNDAGFYGGDYKERVVYEGYDRPIDLYILDNTIENFSSETSGPSDAKLLVSAISEGDYGYNGHAAIELDIGAQGNATIAGNDMGSNFDYGLLGYSGNIDLTGKTNTIHDVNVGMGFYPDDKDGYGFYGDLYSDAYFEYLANRLHLVDDTIGTTAFVDNAEYFVDLGYGAFFAPGYPTLLDGMNATYETAGSIINPSATGFVTPAEYSYLESMINHYVDIQDRGLFFFNVLFPDDVTIDQKDVFRNFIAGGGQGSRGSLVVTGLPNVGGGNGGGAAPFNLNDISPAAGDEEEGQGNIADIQPAAGGDTNNASCWADAAQSLGSGTPVMFNFGGGANQLMQDAANCGTSANAGQTL